MSIAEIFEPQRRVTILLGAEYRGHLRLEWDARNQKEMEKIIQTKMDEGIDFFIMVKQGLRRRVAQQITQVNQITERKVFIKDEAIAALIRAGVAEIAEVKGEEIRTSGRAKTAKEAASKDTVGLRRGGGG